MAKGFSWQSRPSRLGRELDRRVGKIEPALNVLATTHAARGEGKMKVGAEWQDQTGFARSSLYGRAEGTTIYLGTTNGEYGIFLELGTIYMAPRAIIEPTTREVARDYFSDSIKLIALAFGGRNV